MSFKIVDLSHPIDDSMPVYPGDVIPEVKTIATIDKHDYRESELTMSTHTGTHVDSPAHIIPDGSSLDNFSPDKYYGYGIVLDCSQENIISIDTINSIDTSNYPEFILLYTGWDTYWGTDTYFRGFPSLDNEAAKILAGLPVKGIGIDAPSFDPAESVMLSNHKTILSKNIILIENLTGLNNLIEKKFVFSCFPLKIRNADGSPVRATAIIQE
jgi:kynurenine formamidase